MRVCFPFGLLVFRCAKLKQPEKLEAMKLLKISSTSDEVAQVEMQFRDNFQSKAWKTLENQMKIVKTRSISSSQLDAIVRENSTDSTDRVATKQTKSLGSLS
jgi:predicted metal-binding transcription factor (methanogenesis marker protein 9)